MPYEKIGKNEPVCIADEVPFEIPESWEWCRIGELFFLQAGKNISSSSISEKPFANAIPCYGGNGIRGYVKSSNRSGDYPIIGRQGALCGNINRATGDFYATEHAVCVTTFSNTNVSWACVFLKALNLNQYATATAQPGLAVGTINRVLIPVPPVTEQRRITEKLYLLEPLLASYESTHDLIINQQHDFPEQLKKSILQEAVQGKLVPQDPTDEPASALLERIRAEKEQLIKSGKIKRDKHESVIFRRDNSYYERVDGIERCIDDEIPFEIPENWEVVRLQNIGEYRKGPFGSSLTKSMFVPKSKSSIKVYEQKNAIQKDCTLGTYYIPMEYYNEKMKGFTVLPNDIIVSCAGTIGETYILPSSAEIGIINQALMRMRITSQINVDYFLIYFDYMVKETARESSKGSAIKNIPPFDIFKKIILPLPPLKEQKRIVQEVHTIQSLISSL